MKIKRYNEHGQIEIQMARNEDYAKSNEHR